MGSLRVSLQLNVFRGQKSTARTNCNKRTQVAGVAQKIGRNPLDVALGDRILMRRMVLGLTQADLAKAVGVSSQQIQKYERGLCQVRFSTLVRLARALMFTTADVVGDLDRV